jgi:Asp-tRNA(Asn)/Glu-tRNA(Gln) amidotransferase A subunit family amidase
MTNRLSTLDAFAPAHTLLATLRDGQISASALVEFHLARIARYNHELNAIVIPN